MFDLWLAALGLGPIVLAVGFGHFWRRVLARPKVYALIGALGAWCIAFIVAYRVLGNLGISGGASSAASSFDNVLAISLMAFLGSAIAFLIGLRFCMPKRKL
jgi:hypothetical protein